MINKLRKKIFWIIQLSLSIIVIGLIVLFTIFNYRNTINSSVFFMDRIGKLEPREERMPEPRSRNIDGVYEIRIENNSIKFSNATDEIINEYALKVSDNLIDEGYINNYIYRIRKLGSNEVEVTLIESEETIKELKANIIISIGIGVAGLILIYVIAKKISNIIVKPVSESFEKQKQFVSDASHELKTPLAVIEANADVLEAEVGDNKWITYIQNEVQSMNKLVNDLLTLARMENINRDTYQKFDLSKEVKMSVAVFESMIYEKEIKLKTEVEDGIEFNGDKEDIKHIISILLDNAIKHTKEKGKIIVSTTKEKNNIKIDIKNQGDPIPEEEREKIFERFYRIDKARNRNEKRYGLGLSIAKGIIEKYNGTIEAISDKGFTSFIVKL